MKKTKITVNGVERTLGIKLSPFRRKHQVFLDGQPLGEFLNAKESSEGKEFKIDYNNFIKIRYEHKLLGPELFISHNGQDLETSASHPKYKKHNAYGVIILLSVLNLAIGLAGMSNAVPTMSQTGFGAYNFFIGVFYCVALLLFKKFHPFLGIILAFILYSFDSGVVLINLQSNPGMSGGIIVRLMFFGLLIKGMTASFPEFKQLLGSKNNIS